MRASTASGCALAAAWFAAGRCLAGGGGEVAYEIRPWFEISDRGVSPVGKSVHDAEADDYLHAEAEHFVIHARALRDIDEAAAQAEQALRVATAFLDIPPPRQKVQILRVADAAQWDALAKRYGVRLDGLAVQYRNEIFLKDDPSSYRGRERISHEVTHACMRSSFGTHLPLWLEEGLASYLGREALAASMTQKEREAMPRLPAMSQFRLYSLKVLTASFLYPESPADADLFYRMSEDLVAALRERLGDGKFKAFVKSLGAGYKSWDQVLRTDFGFADEDFPALEKAMQDRALAERPW